MAVEKDEDIYKMNLQYLYNVNGISYIAYTETLDTVVISDSFFN